MARKVFISFLGTNNYLQTCYELNGVKSRTVRFVQEPLVDFLCTDWVKDHWIFIFYTGGDNGSKVKNWLDGGQPHTIENQELENKGLQSCLSESAPNLTVEGFEIQEGFSELEIWSIFNTVYSKLLPEDEVYFDVTHAFRSIPMFSVVLFNYAKFMLDIHVASILYGAFEKLGPSFKVKTDIPNPNDRVAPIIDLMSIIKLQDATIAASDFVKYGKMNSFSSLLSSIDKRSMTQSIQKISNDLKTFDYYLATCRIDKIMEGKLIRNILGQIKSAKKSISNNSQIELLNRIKESIVVFGNADSLKNVEYAIDWADKYGMLQQAYTMAEELVITKVCKKYSKMNTFTGNEKNSKERIFRDFISGILGISEKDIEQNKFSNYLSYDINYTKDFLSIAEIKELRVPFSTLQGNRNIINHGKKTDNDLRSDFKGCYDKINFIFKTYVD